ncbi:sensor domain-containing diguanylate cyclase [Pseudomonas sp. microsymbiont 2]
MHAAGKQGEDRALAASGEGRAASLFRLVLSFMAVVMLAFVMLEGWRIWREYREAFIKAEETVTNLAWATAQHAEDTIRQVDAITAALSERLEGDGLQTIDRPRLHAMFKQQMAIMPQLHGLFVYGPDGSWVVSDKDAVPPRVNNADRAYFAYHRDHRDHEVRIGNVVRSRSTGDLILPISRRLEHPDGSFAGVLLGTIKIDWLVRYYGDFKIDEHGVLVLAKRNGTIIARYPFVEKEIGLSLADSEVFRNYLPYASKGVVDAVAVIDGTRRLYAFRALPSYPLVMEAGLSRESILMQWRQDMIKAVILLVLLLIGLAGFGWVVLRQLRERIVIERALHQAHQTLKVMALTDSLTGLGNRRRLDSVLEAEVRRARRQGYPLALVMLDLDHFKAYNDHYGHPAGDECLRRFGTLLRQSLKRPGDLAVRYGGEEFTLLLPNTDAQGASAIVQEILQLLRNMALEHVGSPLGRVSSSAGIAAGTPTLEAITPQSLTAAADRALYEAKRQGRDRYCVADGIEADTDS